MKGIPIFNKKKTTNKKGIQKKDTEIKTNSVFPKNNDHYPKKNKELNHNSNNCGFSNNISFLFSPEHFTDLQNSKS